MSFVPWVYLGVGASSLVLLFGAARVRLRTPSVRRKDALAHEVWETAFLAGGPGRVVDAAIAGMHEDGRLAVGGPGVVTVRQAVAHDAVEAAVLDAIARTPGGGLAALRATAMRSPAVQAVGDRLAARGLLRSPELGRGGAGWRAPTGRPVWCSSSSRCCCPSSVTPRPGRRRSWGRSPR